MMSLSKVGQTMAMVDVIEWNPAYQSKVPHSLLGLEQAVSALEAVY